MQHNILPGNRYTPPLITTFASLRLQRITLVFVDQTEDENNFFGDRPPSSKGLDDPLPPTHLSQGLDPALIYDLVKMQPTL